MKVVKLKKLTNAEIQTKLLMLKAGGQFDDKSLKLIEMSIKNGLVTELEEKQVEFLKSISLVEEEMRSVEQKTQGTQKENRVLRKDIYKETMSSNSTGNIIGEDKKIVVNAERTSEDIYSAAQNSEVREIDAQMNIEIKEESKEKDEESKMEKNFVPNSPEDIADMSPEEIEKMFYLTPERIIESMKLINNGKVWANLAQIGSNTTAIQAAIESAYRSCVYPSDLTNPNFLDERIANYLPDDTQAIHFKELHMAALMGTYVGYHVEKNEEDINSLNADGSEKSNIAIIEFPTIIDEMPQTLKEQTKTELVNVIKHRIEDIIDTSDSYKALMLLVPLENTMDAALLDYSNDLHENKENKTTKAYIKVIREDLSGEMENKLGDLNISMDLYGIDWENPNTRKDVVNMLKTLQGQGRENEINKLVEEINMSFEVNSPSDLAAVRAACADLNELSKDGVEINIAFEMPADERKNEELQQALNEIVDEYENISRDESEETINNTVDEVIEEGVKSSLSDEDINQNQLGKVMTQVMLNNLSMSADLLMDIEQERTTEEEIGFYGRPRGGGV